VKFVEVTFMRLAEKTQAAAAELAEDNYVFTLNVENPCGDSRAAGEVLLPRTMKACETLCNAIGEVELTLSRATSLLQKFPGQYDLVHHLLCRKDGEDVRLTGNSEFHQNAVFQSIQQGILGLLREPSVSKIPMSSCEQDDGTSDVDLPLPFAREYVLHNSDESRPSQLLAQIRGLSMTEEENACILAMSNCLPS